MSVSTSSLLQLQQQITEQKKKLYRLVRTHGYTHPLVIACSQELDQLVVLVMRYLSS
ncbi:Spo0E family sporulation regulatory protein-aspartic acid phosphatase [Bacillus paranthracis]|uniref:Spo0E family sporulation regulatory protein-aspartic acid phosphatase n=1 Tax=Bacillus TaxID=1386 RepID=UPI0018CD916C|nr:MULTISPECIES: aspartyl-phosphate phosphatase Spo0E family protein [Bacillus cereus group]MBG9522366.1 membrane protein [Bacillus thuringiensis]MDF9625152.1 aspartyl-phosphate phosphatase Spo0E family protein [Bacillus cereus]